jgi:hypothetical protein
MYSDSMLDAHPQDRRCAVAAASLQPPLKEMKMQRYYERLKCHLARATVFAAAFATSATLLVAVGGAFYSVSSEPVLADSPQARFAVAGCDARGDRVARQHCVRRLVAEAEARDAGAAQLAALSASQRGALP